ncbi:MAG TPA: hypothetical protein VMB21_04735 [Candidatus Limnocylindria bacterium]|jgi:hypothetical protein|nr:hypothetical protein [Candidatus Limnocylindria bacterium]HTL67231.1 hypothetical protein [Lacunisphaera sp.]
MDERLTLRLTAEMKADWRSRADRQGIDVGELVRQTMEQRRVRSMGLVRADDQRHLSRLALWCVQWLQRASGLLEKSSLNEDTATRLQATLDTLLALFAAVANGEIDIEPVPPAPDASGHPEDAV